jgi:dTDP-4-dehydrorhamnose 3,5-epimerase
VFRRGTSKCAEQGPLPRCLPASKEQFSSGLPEQEVRIKFLSNAIGGCFVIEPDIFPDERGFFAVHWLREEFARHGIEDVPVQSNFSFSREAGTIRGMHYQRAPHEQAKLVRCVRGAIFDVVVDLREGSPSHGSWFGQELTAENHLGMWIPTGCAHGFQTLAPETEVSYFVTAPYDKELESGIRWDDPTIGIRWPRQMSHISEKDRVLPLLATKSR